VSWSNPSNDAARAIVATDRPLRVQIITTKTPSCVIHFQLRRVRVLTARSPWAGISAPPNWTLTLSQHSRLGPGNAQLFPEAVLLYRPPK
jgi:hypothetical protein